MKKNLLACLLLVFPLFAYGDKVTVNLATEGTLEEVIDNQSVSNITDLKIIGKLTAADIIYLRKCEGKIANLSILDLEGVTLVASNEPYNSVVRTWIENKTTVYYFLTDEEIDSSQLTGGGSIGGVSTGGFNYENYKGGMDLAVAFSGMSLEKVVLPASLKKIGEGCFNGCKLLSSVEFPSSVTAIGDEAFKGAESLVSINLSNVSEIGTDAFNGCTSLASVNLGIVTKMGSQAFYGCIGVNGFINLSSLTSIPDGAFYGCTGISGITFSIGLKSIGSNAFYGCTSIASVTFPQGLEIIDEGAFQGCTSITGVGFPTGLKEIGHNAFHGCEGISSITFPEGLETIGANAFNDTKVTSVTFPASLKSIGGNVFHGSSLKSIIFTEGTGELTIWGYAFEDLYYLETVTFAKGLKRIGDDAFERCPKLTSISLPEGLDSIGRMAFYDCYNLSSVSLPSTLKEMGDMAFANTPWAKNQTADDDGILYYGTIAVAYAKEASEGAVIKIKEGTLGIMDDFIYGNSGITAVELPSTLKSIGMRAFSKTSIKAISIPNSVESIGYRAFEECNSLQSVVISESVKEMYSPFYNCTSLTQATVYAKNLSKDSSFGSYLTNMATLTIGSGVSVLPANFIKSGSQLSVIFEERLSSSELFIGNQALASSQKTTLFLPNCRIALDDNALCGDKFASFEIPGIIIALGHDALYSSGVSGTIRLSEEIKSIEENAFYNCTGLTSVIISNELTTIGASAFSSCSSLESITLPESLEAIGNYTFFGCEKLSSIRIPASVTRIGNCAFYDCTSLNEVSITGSLTEIGDKAFYGCSGLKKLTISGNVNQIGVLAFGGLENLTEVLITGTVGEIGERCFFNCKNLSSLTILSETSIGDHSFSSCTNLSSLTLGAKGLKSVLSSSFTNCSSLTNIYVQDIMSWFKCPLGTRNSDGYIDTPAVENPEWKLYSNGKEVVDMVISDGVTAIDNEFCDYALVSCISISTITFPNSLTTIGAYTFEGIPNLQSVTCKATTPPDISVSQFSSSLNGKRISTLYVPAGSKKDYEDSNWKNDFNNIVEIDASSEPKPLNVGETFTADMSGTIGIFVVTGSKTVNLKKCGNVSKVEVPSTITYNGVEYTITGILGSATGDANQPNQPVFGSNVTEVVIPNTVESIGACAFWYCENMTSVTIPNSVTSIGDNAFLGSGLTSVIIPAGVTSIGEWAFTSCYSLTKVVALDDTPVNISSNPRFSDNILQSATLYVPSGKTTVYKNAGWNFTNIVELSALNDGDTFEATVDGTTFKVKVLSAADKTCQIGADGRGDGLVSRGKDWNGLIPSKVTGSDFQEYTVIGIGNRAFWEYGSVVNLILPKTLQFLSEGAFMRCENLMYVTIPTGLKTVGGLLFNGQEILTEVVSLIEDPEAINSISIDCGGRYGNKATLVVPAGMKATYQNADGWNHFPRIVEMKQGDANGDDNLGQEDVEIAKDFIMTHQNPDGFVRHNADTNGDNKVNVVDIVNIVNLINKP